MKLVKILSDKVQIRSDYKEFDDVETAREYGA